MITCQIMSTTRKHIGIFRTCFRRWQVHIHKRMHSYRYLFCTSFISILSTAQYIVMKKNQWPTLGWTALFLREVFSPSKLIWPFYIVHKYKNYTSGVAQKSEWSLVGLISNRIQNLVVKSIWQTRWIPMLYVRILSVSK